MSFEKRTYTAKETVITAKNLNDIQDELIRLGKGEETLVVRFPPFSHLPKTVYNPKITKEYRYRVMQLSDPTAPDGPWYIIIRDGTVTLSGPVHCPTDATITLSKAVEEYI